MFVSLLFLVDLLVVTALLLLVLWRESWDSFMSFDGS